MEIKFDLNFYDLQKFCWCGAIPTLNRIEKENLGGELMTLLEEIFLDEMPTITQVNDFLWFESDYIYGCLGILDNVDDADDEE